MMGSSHVATARRLCCLGLAGAGLAVALCAWGQEARPTEGWLRLFNGKDLDGWQVKIAGYELNDNHGNLFRVEEGVLRVAYDQYQNFNGEFGHIFYQTPYSHYILRLEYRFVGEQVSGGPGWAFRNSGVMIHSQSPESLRKDQAFPVSIEVQFLGGSGQGERSTANLCTPGTHVVMNDTLLTQHCLNSRSKTFHGDQWVSLEVEVHGNSQIRHLVNGEVVLEYEKPQLDPGDGDAKALIAAQGGEVMLKGGYIALQAESHPLEFRNIELFPLKE
jgi:hypothetical protein